MMKCHCLLTVDFMAVVVGGSSVTMSPRKHLLLTSILNTLDILRYSFNPKMGTFLPFLSQSNLGAKLYPMTEQLGVFKLVLTALHIREYCLDGSCGELFLDW